MATLSPDQPPDLTTLTTDPPPRILFVDDDPLAWRMLSEIIASQGFEVFQSDPTTDAVVQAVDDCAPDVVVLDLYLGLGVPDGIELARVVRQSDPALPVILCTSSESPSDALRAWNAGVSAYITKGWLLRHPDDLAAVFRLACVGAVLYFVDPHAAPEGRPLSARQLEVLRFKVQGRSHRDIATALHINTRTVDAHLAHIRERLGATDIEDMKRIALERGLAIADPDTGE